MKTLEGVVKAMVGDTEQADQIIEYCTNETINYDVYNIHFCMDELWWENYGRNQGFLDPDDPKFVIDDEPKTFMTPKGRLDVFISALNL